MSAARDEIDRWASGGGGSAHDRLAALAVALERAMRDAGMWQEAPPPRPVEIRRAFAADQLAFSQWLQIVLIPRMNEIVDRREALPPSSDLAANAVREWDGDDGVGGVVAVLHEIDALTPARPGSGNPYAPRFEPFGRSAKRYGVACAAGGVALVWCLIAWEGVERAADALAGRMPRTLIQEFEVAGLRAAPLTAASVRLNVRVDRDGSLHPTELELLSARGGRMVFARPVALDLSRAATGPDGVDALPVIEFLVVRGADRTSTEVEADAAAILDVARAFAAAKTREELLLPARRVGSLDVRTAGDPIDVPGHVPASWRYTAFLVLGLLGAVPVLYVLYRIGRRRRAARGAVDLVSGI